MSCFQTLCHTDSCLTRTPEDERRINVHLFSCLPAFSQLSISVERCFIITHLYFMGAGAKITAKKKRNQMETKWHRWSALCSDFYWKPLGNPVLYQRSIDCIDRFLAHPKHLPKRLPVNHNGKYCNSNTAESFALALGINDLWCHTMRFAEENRSNRWKPNGIIEADAGVDISAWEHKCIANQHFRWGLFHYSAEDEWRLSHKDNMTK